MNFALTEDQQALQSLAREIVTDLAAHERLAKLEAAGQPVFDRDGWAKFAEAGLIGIGLPEERGGGGLSFLETALVAEEVGRGPAYLPYVPATVSALAIARFGGDAQLVSGVADGSKLSTFALDEPGEADYLAPQTTYRDGTISGEKSLVPYGAEADFMLVSASVDDGVGVFVADTKSSGIEAVPLHTTNHEPHAHVTFDNVPAEQLGDADVVHFLVTHGDAALACLQAGVCDAALRLTAQYTSNRRQFDKPIAEFQAVAQRAADAYVDTECIRLTAHQAASRLAAGLPADEEVATAKFWAGDGGSRVVHACQHLHGGIGVDLDYPVHRYFLWTKQIEHTLGTPTRSLLRLGRLLATTPV